MKKEQTEDQLQHECYVWFYNKYPKYRKLLFSVPNGGKRDPREAQKLKSTGVVAGVADMLLMCNKTVYCIEMKTTKGTQQKNQKEWQNIVTEAGYKYFICRSFEQFKYIIEGIVK